MTEHELELARALGNVAGWTGARFMESIAVLAQHDPAHALSLRQRHYMEIMAWRYRRQLAPHLVPDVKPPTLPKKRREPKPRKHKTAAPAETPPMLLLFVGIDPRSSLVREPSG